MPVHGKPLAPPRRAPVTWWQRYYSCTKSEGQKPHPPGLWVLYFSILALPIFGFGQGLIPVQQTQVREHAFLCLWLYVAAALSLLVTTSFLGLRRYLRQRRLQMPATMAGAWIFTGAAIIFVVLGLCLLLPRPQATWSATALLAKLGSPEQKAAPYTLSPDSAVAGEGYTNSNSQNPSDPTIDPSAARGTASAEDQESQNSGAQSQSKSGDASSQSRPGRSAISHRSSIHTAAQMFRWLLYLALAGFLIYFLVRFAKPLFRALVEILRSLVSFWSNLWSFNKSRPVPNSQTVTQTPPSRPFAQFANPFLSGWAAQATPAELIIYSYEALQAWAMEYQCARQPEQTPLEFARLLGDQVPEIAQEAWHVARLYACVAYAGQRPLPECTALLDRLWRKMAPPS